MNLANTKSTVLMLTLATVVALSPLVQAFSPIKGNVIFVLAAIFVLIIKASWRGIDEKYFFWCLGIVFIECIPALYWQEPRLMLITVYFVLSILVISVLDKNDINIFVEFLTWIVLVLLFGAAFGVLYAYFGGEPILEFANPDGRLNQLYITTLTNSQFENFIRPSGIFDEPGALSFITCFVAALRHALGKNKKVTWILLILGFVTTSVAHLVYTFLHAIDELKGHRSAKNLFIAAAVVICALAFMTLFESVRDIYSTLFLSRFSNGQLGQDRVTTFMSAIGYINVNTFMFGLDSECAVGLANCVDLGFESYGDNPLTLLVHWCGFLAFPYYFALTYLAVNSARQLSFVMLGILLLLLQRPYTMSYGYSMLIVLTIFALTNEHARVSMRKLPKMPNTLDILPTA